MKSDKGYSDRQNKSAFASLDAEMWTSIALATVLTAAAIFHVSHLYDGHNWGDDFGLYLQLARNIVTRSAYGHLNTGVLVPPGVPLIFAAIMSFGSHSLVAFKVVNSISWWFFAFAQYLYARGYFDRTIAVGSALVLITLPFLFAFQQWIGSDFINAAVTIIALTIATKILGRSSKTKRFALNVAVCLILVLFSILLRAASLALVVSLVLWVSWSVVDTRRESEGFIKLAIFGAGLFGLLVFWLWLSSHFYGDYFHQVSGGTSLTRDPTSFIFDKFHLIWRRFGEEILNLSTLLNIGAKAWAAIALSCAVAAGALVKVKRHGLDHFDCFVIVYLTMVFLYPEENGPRYLLPVLPMILTYAISLLSLATLLVPRRISFGFPILPVAVIGWMLATNAAGIWAGREYNDDEIGTPDAREALIWLREHTTPGQLIASYKPRAVMYLAQLTAYDLYPSASVEAFQRMGAQLVFARKAESNASSIASLSEDSRALVVFENANYIIFRIITTPVVEHEKNQVDLSVEHFRLLKDPAGALKLLSPEGTSIPIMEHAVRWSIDSILARSPVMTFKGWAANARDRMPAQKILIFAGERSLYTEVLNRPRGDVAQFFGTSALWYGFEISLLTNRLNSEEINDIRIFALSQDGMATEMKYDDEEGSLLRRVASLKDSVK